MAFDDTMKRAEITVLTEPHRAVYRDPDGVRKTLVKFLPWVQMRLFDAGAARQYVMPQPFTRLSDLGDGGYDNHPQFLEAGRFDFEGRDASGVLTVHFFGGV